MSEIRLQKGKADESAENPYRELKHTKLSNEERRQRAENNKKYGLHDKNDPESMKEDKFDTGFGSSKSRNQEENRKADGLDKENPMGMQGYGTGFWDRRREKKDKQKNERDQKAAQKKSINSAYGKFGIPKTLVGVTSKLDDEMSARKNDFEAAASKVGGDGFGLSKQNAAAEIPVQRRALEIKDQLKSYKTPHGFICSCLGCKKITGGCCGGSEGHKLTGGGCGSLIGGFPGCDGGANKG
ncbi:MAG: hypothetical protein FWE53_04845 [Firmicutes bacterium]|nr:hypothetical protein [Bacillota bacterium]